MTEGKAEGDGRRRKLQNDHGWPLCIPARLAFLKLEAAFIDASPNRFFSILSHLDFGMHVRKGRPPK